MQSRSPKITIKMGGKRPEIASLNVNGNHETLEKDQRAFEGPSVPSHSNHETLENDQSALEGLSVPSHSNHETLENDQSALEGLSVPSHSDGKETDQNVLDVSLSEYSTEDEDKDTPLCDDSQKQIVLYDYSLNGSEVVKAVKKRKSDKPPSSSRRPPEVGAFTVQCANCLKWRLIPDQDKYEVIREHITEKPFTCETTRQWNRDVSCDDPTDIEQDGTRIWAIDKPSIAQPPPGWRRLLRLRREGSSKFADVYYASPTGAKLRSLPDVVKYLKDHPEHAQGIGLERFSFQIPRPLQENYVKKRPKMPATTSPGYLEPSLAVPVHWAGPEEKMDLQLAEPISWGGPMLDQNGIPEYLTTPEFDPVNRAATKAKRYDFDCL